MTRIRIQTGGFDYPDRASSGGQTNILADGEKMERSGWVKRIGLVCGGESASNPTNIQLALWKREDDASPPTPEFYGPIQLTGAKAWRYAEIPDGVPVRYGENFFIGFGSNYGEIRRWTVEPNQPNGPGYYGMYSEEYRVPPILRSDSILPGKLSRFYDYVPNIRPLQGRWVRPNSPDTTETDPLWIGTLPHHPEEENLDHSGSIRVRIYDMTAGGGLIYDKSLPVSSKENNVGQWTRRLTELTAGRTYEADYLHVDSFGSMSLFSDRVRLKINTGPRAPQDISHVEKLNTLTPSITMRYSHPQSTPGHRLGIIIRSLATNTEVGRIIHNPAANIPQNGVYSLKVSTGILEWGTAYRFIYYAIDVNQLTGDAEVLDCKTNSFPVVPSDLSPPAGSIDSSGRFSAYSRDPDGDQITSANLTITSVSTGQEVLSRFPMVVSPSGAGAALSADIDTSILAIGESYSYQVRAKDLVGEGRPNSPITFKYARVPSAIMIAPSPKQRRNLIPRPSAELNEQEFLDYWTISGGDPILDNIEVFPDSDSAEGDASYRAVIGNGVGLEMRGKRHEVVASRPYLFRSEMKKEFASGISASKVYLECIGAAGTSLGVVYPVGGNLIDSAGVDLPPEWSEFWGVIGPEGSSEYGSAFPVGTKQVEVVWEPGESSSVAVRADAFWLEKLPLASSSIQFGASDLFGYIPLSFPGYGSEDLYGEVYVPTGIEKLGPSVAKSPQPQILFDYFSPDGVDKVADRLVVKKEVRSGRWDVVHSGDWFTGSPDEAASRESLLMPPSVLKNEGRYSIQVLVRDGNGIEGKSEPVQLDTVFRGPPQIQIVNLEERSDRAEFGISLSESDLEPSNFGGIEIAVKHESGLIEVVDFIASQGTTESSYRFPEAHRDYEFLTRQISLADGQEIEGRWTSAHGKIDYDEWWIKDVSNLGIELPIRVRSSDEVSLSSAQPELASYRPLGSLSRSYISSPALQENSQLVLRIYDSDPDRDEKVEMAESLRLESRVVCILSQRPSDKAFARINQVTRVSAHVPFYAIYTFDWSEAGYLENYYARTTR